MNSRLLKVLNPLATPAALLVLVVVLGFSFLAIVLVPGLELASEVADSCDRAQAAGRTAASSDPHPRGSGFHP